MDRRQLLAASTGCLGCVAGCTAVDLPALTADLDRRIERVGIGTGAAETMQEAADDGSTARQRVSDANDLLDAFRAVEVGELRTVAVALGLVRGFDREDDAGTVDDEL